MPPAPKIVVIREKFEQGPPLAAVIGTVARFDPASDADKRDAKRRGFIECRGGVVVTWVRGHAFEQVPPDDVDDRWAGAWRFDTLPIDPEETRIGKRFASSPDRFFERQVPLVADLARGAELVVIATDPDRAGEAIGHDLIDHIRPGRGTGLRRMRLKDTTADEMGRLWRAVRDDEGSVARHLPEAWEERARSYEDYVAGYTASRASQLRLVPRELGRAVMPAGNVMTPTLALIVDREDAIRTFVPRVFWTIEATVAAAGHRVVLTYAPKAEAERIWEKAQADAAVRAARGHRGPLRVSEKSETSEPPRPYNRSALDKDAGAVLGFSLDRTEKALQSLYEAGFVTYPRTPNTYYEPGYREKIPAIAAAAGAIGALAQAADAVAKRPRPRSKWYDGAKTTAHSAIHPTGKPPRDLDADETALYALIAANWLANHLDPAEDAVTTIRLDLPVEGRKAPLPLTCTGRVEISPGWRIAAAAVREGFGRRRSAAPAARRTRARADASGADDAPSGADAGAEISGQLPRIPDGMRGEIEEVRAREGKTTPPKRFKTTELTSVMGRLIDHVDDPALKRALRGDDPEQPRGLGTDATRKATVEKLEAYAMIRISSSDEVAPTAKGTVCIAGWRRWFPEFCDVATRAETELELGAIGGASSPAEAERRYRAYCEKARERVARLVRALADASPVVPDHVAPEDLAAQRTGAAVGEGSKLHRFASRIAEALGIPLEADPDDAAALGAFIDRHKAEFEAGRGDRAARRPMTDKQIAALERNAADLDLPEDWRTAWGAAEASAALDRVLGGRTRGGGGSGSKGAPAKPSRPRPGADGGARSGGATSSGSRASGRARSGRTPSGAGRRDAPPGGRWR
jgi:DNA topoisomerase-3